MTAMTSQMTRMEELAHRSGDGLDVTLYWRRGPKRVSVCVCDHRRGAYFEIRPPADRALDAFYHPYAYTASSTLHFEDERLAA